MFDRKGFIEVLKAEFLERGILSGGIVNVV